MTRSKRPSEELFREYLAGGKKAYSAIRGDAEHLVRAIAKNYKSPGVTIKELIPVGMTYFDTALRHYIKYREKTKRPYKFSTYFTWWIRESIRTYLGRSKEPLRGVKPRRNQS